MITINGILLAVFSLVDSLTDNSNSLLIQVVVGACVISLVLLVYNFLATKLTYYSIGGVLYDEGAELTEKEMNDNIRRTLSRRKFIIISERICLMLLVLEAIIVFVFVINSTISGNAA